MGKIAIALFAVLLAGVATAGSLPDTGQTKCYDNSGNEITCPSEGEPLYGQDGNYVKQRSYTVLAGGQIVQDNVTGLMWEAKTNDGSIHDWDNKYTWYEPNPDTNGSNAGTQSTADTKDFIDALNDSNFGGYSDWRLPTIKELASIVNLGKESSPRIDHNFFQYTQSGHYWSSTTIAYSTGNAWSVYFANGNGGYSSKSDSYYVRAVREGQW